MTAQLLEEVLPIQTNVSSIFYNTQRVSERLEKDLGKEQYMFIEGCQRDWEALPRPDKPLIVGIDGGYVHAREGKNRKAGCFEVIVGKSLQDEHETKRFGFVTKYDTKPKRRLHEMLNNQGLQMNQTITFLTDGGDTVRDLQFYISPQSEHILDWFHVTMRITVLKQMVKNVSIECCAKPEEELESIKWYLWHGNVFKALQLLELFDDDCAPDPESKCAKRNKLSKTVSEFYEYINNNRDFIPNYAERYRYGEAISSAFVESTVNELISKRMVKQQQMRWTQKGAHLLLQVRIKTLNHELRNCFCKWYPRMTPEAERAAA